MQIWNLAYSITNKCNLQCTHCYASSGIPYEDELDISEICSLILDEAKKIGTRFITLTGGEPFTRKDIFQIICEIKKRGIRVCIATNGMLLSKSVIEILEELDVDRIQISLEGANPEKNNKIRGKGVFEKITQEVIPELKKSYLFTAVSVTPTITNYQDMEQIAEMCWKLGVDTLSIRRFSSEGRGKTNSLEVNIKENQWLLKEIQRLQKQYAGILNISTGDPLYALMNEKRDEYAGKRVLGGCTAGITSLAIDAHGNIRPCTRANLNLGNVRRDSMSDVWKQNEVLQKIRDRSLYEGKCGTCKYKMLCGGCRVSSLEHENSITGADIKCWL